MIHILQIIENYFAHHLIFSAGLLLIMGYIFGELAEKLKLPAITGYILAGILVGSSGLQMIRRENLEILNILSEITLSFIAVIIGGEFSVVKLRIYGSKIIIITLIQMFLTFGLVSAGLMLLGIAPYVSFLLGAISAATAPAATVVIVEKLKARGEFVDYLYGIVALDDAGTVILFSVAFALSASLISGTVTHISSSVLHAFKEIFSSLFIGIIGGLLIHLAAARKRNINEIKIISLGILFMTTSIAISLKLSPLITNMTVGMLLINISKKNIKILTSLEPLTAPLYAIFFAIAGAELRIEIFRDTSVILAGVTYIFLRALGKYFGVYSGARLLKLKPSVRNYLGLSLLPQAGVAIGLVLFVQGSPMISQAAAGIQVEISKMINIVLMSVFFNELIGPPLAKFAILKNLKRRG
ncbi:MAG: cation:proton antiporter [Candidatus Cloacimonetes bacterium]|nr:cation:proton antiporter [Candidatus Cloacimonadota bacterium]